MENKSFSEVFLQGLEFAKQKRFLAIQTSFYLAVTGVFVLLCLLCLTAFSSVLSSRDLSSILAGASITLALFIGIILLLALSAWVCAQWLELFFYRAVGKFLGGNEKNWKQACTLEANKNFGSFVAVSLLLGLATSLGSLFFFLLELQKGTSGVASPLGALYSMFFSVAFVYSPFYASQSTGVWASLSKSLDDAVREPFRAILVALSVQIVSILAVIGAAFALAVGLGIALALYFSLGLAAGVIGGLVFGIGGLVCAFALVSYANLAAIGIISQSKTTTGKVLATRPASKNKA